MIYTNQLGYLPSSNKIAVSTVPCNYQVIDATTQKSVLDGSVGTAIEDKSAGENVYHIDFSNLTTPGDYYILAGNGGKSHVFSIRDDIYDKLITDISRCLYYQRCGCGLDEEHAGIYKRPVCHTEPSIMLSDYLSKKADAKKYDMTGGWHDAGDFGRYVSAGAVAVAHILYAYDLFPETLGYGMNIPESGNGIPDILNECAYELKWMLKMQAPDGGVYHKLTAFNHADFIMPEQDLDQFIIFPVASFTTADFVAVMALASRIYKDFMPEFSIDCLNAAKRGAEWLSNNSYIAFKNPDGCNTGEYDDDDDLDERIWAASEMLRVDPDNKDKYLVTIKELLLENISMTDFGWTDVSGMAALSILTDPKHTSGIFEANVKHTVLLESSRLYNELKNSGYQLGMLPDDFVWGSNMVVANRAILFALASIIADDTIKPKYEQAVEDHLHYLLGRNPLDISYITGFGENAFRHPHNRVTEMDGIDSPMPGWVSGGPFKTPCDPAAEAAIPKGTAPMKCYVDDVGSYSTNEITIYWNSPVIFMLAFIKSTHSK